MSDKKKNEETIRFREEMPSPKIDWEATQKDSPSPVLTVELLEEVYKKVIKGDV